MQITEHVHAIKIPFQVPVAPERILERFVYAYLILGSGICLIDSGVKNSEAIIFGYLKNLGRMPREVSLLILTHAHPDHIGSARAIKNTTNCTVAAHHEAKSWVEDVEQQFKERPVPGFHNLVDGSIVVDRLLQDGEVITLGPVSLEVFHTPGHAQGAISLYCREEGVLFAGDAILQENDLPIYEDAALTVASIKKLKDIKKIDFLLSSWADPIDGRSALKMMDDGLAYLQRIHDTIREIAIDDKLIDPMDLCARVVKVLGLPEVAVNPLIAKSFVSHMRIIDQEKLL